MYLNLNIRNAILGVMIERTPCQNYKEIIHKTLYSAIKIGFIHIQPHKHVLDILCAFTFE